MKIYEVTSSSFIAGIKVQEHILTSGVKIPVVGVGENGRGSKFSFLPVRDAGINVQTGEEMVAI